MNRVVGLLVANDKEDYIDMVIDSVSGIIDDLVFIDDMSCDRTVEIVKSRSEHYGINLMIREFNAETTRRRMWSEAVGQGVKLCKGSGWLFIVDPDTIVMDAESIRSMLDAGEHDEYWFKSLNLCGDMTNDYIGDMNSPCCYIFRSNMEIETDDMGCHVIGNNSRDMTDRFIGWNLSWLQYADKIFEHYQRWFAWVWNKHHGTDMDLSEFLCAFFSRDTTGEPSESYMKVFVLNRLRAKCRKAAWIAEEMGIDEAEFRKKYMIIPQSLEGWDCLFELQFDDDGDIIGRYPDLMATSILDDSQIYQIANLDEYRSWLSD